MASQLETQIRQRIDEYVSGKVSIADFEVWLAPISWNAETADSDARDLVYEIELRIAELDIHSDESRLKENLASLLHPITTLSTELTSVDETLIRLIQPLPDRSQMFFDVLLSTARALIIVHPETLQTSTNRFLPLRMSA